MIPYYLLFLFAFIRFSIEDFESDIQAIDDYIVTKRCARPVTDSLPSYCFDKTLRYSYLLCNLKKHYQRFGRLTLSGEPCFSHKDCEMSEVEKKKLSVSRGSCVMLKSGYNFGLCCLELEKPRNVSINVCFRDNHCEKTERCETISADGWGFCTTEKAKKKKSVKSRFFITVSRLTQKELKNLETAPKKAANMEPLAVVKPKDVLETPRLRRVFSDVLNSTVQLELNARELGKDLKKCSLNSDCEKNQYCDHHYSLNDDTPTRYCSAIKHLPDIEFLTDRFRGLAECETVEDCNTNSTEAFCIYFPDYPNNGFCVKLNVCESGGLAFPTQQVECFSDFHCSATSRNELKEISHCEKITLPFNTALRIAGESRGVSYFKRNIKLCCNDWNTMPCKYGKMINPATLCRSNHDCNKNYDGGPLNHCDKNINYCCREVPDSRHPKCLDRATFLEMSGGKKNRKSNCPPMVFHGSRHYYNVSMMTGMRCHQNRKLYYHSTHAYCDPTTNTVRLVGIRDLKSLVKISFPCEKNSDCHMSSVCIGLYTKNSGIKSVCVEYKHDIKKSNKWITFSVISYVTLVVSGFLTFYSYRRLESD